MIDILIIGILVIVIIIIFFLLDVKKRWKEKNKKKDIRYRKEDFEEKLAFLNKEIENIKMDIEEQRKLITNIKEELKK